MNRCSPFIATVLALAFVPYSQAETAVFKSGMIEPFSLVFAEDGTAYGVEYEKGNRVFSISPGGQVQFIAGGNTPGGKKLGDVAEGDGGNMAGARFNGMHELALHPDGMRIFIADTFNHRIRLLDLEAGTVSTFAGTGGKAGFGGDDGPAVKAKFNQPYTVALDFAGEKLLITDLGNFRVREIDLKSGTITTVAGNGKKGIPKDGEPATSQPLVSPRAACYGPGGTVYIASRNGNAVREVDAQGNICTIVSKSGEKGYSGNGGPATEALINGPKHLCLDGAGNLIITDDVNHCIRLYSPTTGKIHLIAGVPENAGTQTSSDPLKTQLNRPHGARLDAQGRLWVADSMNHRVLRFEKLPSID